MTFTLVGFIAELAGSEGHVFEAAPVVQRDDITYAARGLDWTPDDLVALKSPDAPTFHPIADRAAIHPGETVWVGGRAFVEGVRYCSFAEESAFEIGAWSTGVRGSRTYAGTRRAFAELVQRLRYRLENGMHVSLFEPLELFNGDAPTLYALYSALPVKPDLDYQLTRALYFESRRDNYSLEFIRTETVHVFQLVENEEAFELELRRLESRLARPRLGEQTGGLPSFALAAIDSFVSMELYTALRNTHTDESKSALLRRLSQRPSIGSESLHEAR